MTPEEQAQLIAEGRAFTAAIQALPGQIDAALEKALQTLNGKTSRKGLTAALLGNNPGTQDVKKTFGHFLLAIKTGDREALNVMGAEWEPWTKTSMTGGQGTSGGFMVPTEMHSDVMMYAVSSAIMRKYAITIPQGAKETEVPCIDVVTAPTAGNNAMLGGVVFNWTEEASAETQTPANNNLLKQCRLINYELTGFTNVSNTLMEDTGGALEAVLKLIFGKGIAWTEDYAFFRGSGAGKPLGIVTWAGLISVTRSAASAFALADMAGMLARMVPNLGRQFWCFTPTALAKLYSLVATSTMFQGNFQADPSGIKLAGKPVEVFDGLPALNTAGDILLCSGEGYLIGDRKRLSIAYSEGPNFTSNQTTWRVVNRVAGRPWATDKTTLPDATNTVGPFIALAAG